ncbi:hypothetical protein ACI6PS_11295 [Flavobacterium sp. PLA-1-15]|uniref:hypothetical protein n=1 Tax=Flavobacterium sp. PLA-1-15 TaxID=3380533 RepID=UPI003B7F1590
MKKTILLLLLAFTFACNKDDDNNSSTNPIDQLPPPTQIGANTFGCLLDGKVFKPGTGPNPLDCVYQLINGEYYFSLQANKRDTENNTILIGLSTNAKQINQNTTYALAGNIPANAYGTYALAGIFNTTDDANYIGEMTITYLNNQIVSGTFWFDVLDFQGNLHEIREGRFDMQYTN